MSELRASEFRNWIVCIGDDGQPLQVSCDMRGPQRDGASVVGWEPAHSPSHNHAFFTVVALSAAQAVKLAELAYGLLVIDRRWTTDYGSWLAAGNKPNEPEPITKAGRA